MRLSITREEAAAIVEALTWAVYHIDNSPHSDDGKPARIQDAKSIRRSVAAKVKAAKAAGRKPA